MAEEKENKYKGLSPEIAHEIETYEIDYFKCDKPIPFCGLTLFPVIVKDYEIFASCSTCLTLNKNDVPEGVRMSQLDYLVHKMQDEKEGEAWSYKIQKMFEIIFHLNNGIKCKKCNHIIEYTSNDFIQYIRDVQNAKTNNTEIPPLVCPNCGGNEFSEMIKLSKNPETGKYQFLIDGHIIDKEAYDRLRQIVLFQNFPDYRDDSWVDPSIKADYRARMELEAKKNDAHATLEKKIVCLSIATGYKFEDIYNMPIRKFTMALSAVDDLINYKITKSAIMSGFASLPKGKTIEHWIYKPDKDMYGDAYKSTDEVKQDAGNL